MNKTMPNKRLTATISICVLLVASLFQAVGVPQRARALIGLAVVQPQHLVEKIGYGAPASPIKLSAAADTPMLPIEVFNGIDATGANTVTLANGTGVGGAVRAVTVTVANAGSVAKLWLQMYSLSYQNKASVQINNSSWVTLNNTTTQVLGSGGVYGGIGGAFRTIKLTVAVPAGSVSNGPNVIRFKFNKTDGESMGFRVINFNFLDASDARLLPNPPLPVEDPATWQPPSSAPADIAEGETLWRKRNFMVGSPRSEDVAVFKAGCADCHAQSGYDLKYFNFSNASIIERSKFHGLTQTQGEKIASFIRTRPFASPGRPWNPPYQPGPGLEAKPIVDWAAGAGVDFVLDSDTEIVNYLPGGGMNPNLFVDGARFKNFNVRDIPVAIELPDWNHWLPRAHPMDSMGEADFLSSPNYLYYDAIRKGLLGELDDPDAPGSKMSRDKYIYTKLRRDLDEWAYYWDNSSMSNAFRALGPATGQPWTKKQVKEQYAATIWGASKLFELMHEFGLEGLGRPLYGLQGESRQWLNNRHVFNLSPHLLNMTHAFPVSGDAKPELINFYFANAWYWLQILLSPGARNAVTGGIDTNDWDYTADVMGNLELETGRRDEVRSALLALKGMDAADNGYAPNGRDRGGLDGPYWGWDLRDNTSQLVSAWKPGYWLTVPNSQTVLSTIYQMWLEKSATFTEADWRKSLVPREVAFNLAAPPYTYTIGVHTTDGSTFENPQPAQEDAATFLDYHIRHVKNELRLPKAIPNAMADFGKLLWPFNPWETLKVQSGAAPTGLTATVNVENIALSWSPLVNATSYNIKRSEALTGVFMSVGLFVTQTQFVDRDLQASRAYHYAVSANMGDEETTNSGIVSATPITGLVGYWSFDGAAGLAPLAGGVQDQSITQNPTQWVGSVTATVGHTGSGVSLGGQGFIATERNLRWLSQDFTLAAWVKTTVTGDDNLTRAPALAGNVGEAMDNPFDPDKSKVQRRYEKVGNRFLVVGGLDSAGKIGLSLGTDISVSVKSAQAINDGAWHHVALMRDMTSGRVKVFVDGKISMSGTLATGLLYQRAFSLGRLENPYLASYWQGGLDEVRIYDRPLTDDEVWRLYNDKAIDEPPPTPTPTPTPPPPKKKIYLPVVVK